MSASTRVITFEAIGTSWTIDIADALSKQILTKLEKQILHRIAEFDKTYSRFRDDSLVARIASQPGTYHFPDDAKALFAFYEQLYKITNGKVTPLIGKLLADAGYDAAYSLKPAPNLKPALSWEAVMSYKHPYLSTHQEVLLDFGAAGKGYLVDIVSELLISNKIASFLIDAGGDMLRYDNIASPPARIGLEHPYNPEQVIGVALLGNESMCASAGNRRQWAGLHHIMDPDSAQPIRDIIATWVIAKTALVADGLATALFFTPAAKLKKDFDFEYLFIRSDMSFVKSDRLGAEIFTE